MERQADIAGPSVALAALTRQQSTFTRRDLARLVVRHTADAEQFTTAMAKVGASPELVRLGRDGSGQERFTTRELLVSEQRMEQVAVALPERQSDAPSRSPAAASGTGGAGARAYRSATRMPKLSVVVGCARSGKRTMLGTARAAWEAEGYQVRGAALSGNAAGQWAGGPGIASWTMDGPLFQWEQERETLTARDVLGVDEAGMVGSRRWNACYRRRSRPATRAGFTSCMMP